MRSFVRAKLVVLTGETDPERIMNPVVTKMSVDRLSTCVAHLLQNGLRDIISIWKISALKG